MTENNIDLALINSLANVFYYTVFNSDPHERFKVLIVDNRNMEFNLFVPALDKEIAKNDFHVQDVIPISVEENSLSNSKMN